MEKGRTRKPHQIACLAEGSEGHRRDSTLQSARMMDYKRRLGYSRLDPPCPESSLLRLLVVHRGGQRWLLLEIRLGRSLAGFEVLLDPTLLEFIRLQGSLDFFALSFSLGCEMIHIVREVDCQSNCYSLDT